MWKRLHRWWSNPEFLEWGFTVSLTTDPWKRPWMWSQSIRQSDGEYHNIYIIRWPLRFLSPNKWQIEFVESTGHPPRIERRLVCRSKADVIAHYISYKLTGVFP